MADAPPAAPAQQVADPAAAAAAAVPRRKRKLAVMQIDAIFADSEKAKRRRCNDCVFTSAEGVYLEADGIRCPGNEAGVKRFSDALRELAVNEFKDSEECKAVTKAALEQLFRGFMHGSELDDTNTREVFVESSLAMDDGTDAVANGTMAYYAFKKTLEEDDGDFSDKVITVMAKFANDNPESATQHSFWTKCHELASKLPRLGAEPVGQAGVASCLEHEDEGDASNVELLAKKLLKSIGDVKFREGLEDENDGVMVLRAAALVWSGQRWLGEIADTLKERGAELVVDRSLRESRAVFQRAVAEARTAAPEGLHSFLDRAKRLGSMPTGASFYDEVAAFRAEALSIMLSEDETLAQVSMDERVSTVRRCRDALFQFELAIKAAFGKAGDISMSTSLCAFPRSIVKLDVKPPKTTGASVSAHFADGKKSSKKSSID